MDDDITPLKYAKYICGKEPLPVESKLIIKRYGYVVKEDYSDYNSLIQAGIGSAYGGQWKPEKPQDEWFLGEPDEIKETIVIELKLKSGKMAER